MSDVYGSVLGARPLKAERAAAPPAKRPPARRTDPAVYGWTAMMVALALALVARDAATGDDALRGGPALVAGLDVERADEYFEVSVARDELLRALEARAGGAAAADDAAAAAARVDDDAASADAFEALVPRRLRLQVWPRRVAGDAGAAAEGGFFALEIVYRNGTTADGCAREAAAYLVVTDLYGTRMRIAPRAARGAAACARGAGGAGARRLRMLDPSRLASVADGAGDGGGGDVLWDWRADAFARLAAPRNASALAAARAERGGGAAEAVLAAGDDDGALLDVDETDRFALASGNVVRARCVNALNATAWAAARRGAPQFAASVDELAAPAARGGGAAWLPAWRLEVHGGAVCERGACELADRGGWRVESVERFYEAPLVRNATCAGGRLRFEAHDNFEQARAAPGTYRVLSAAGDVLEEGALAFEPRWAPAVVAVELAGAHAEVRLVVTNMWGDQTLLDVDCDE